MLSVSFMKPASFASNPGDRVVRLVAKRQWPPAILLRPTPKEVPERDVRVVS